MPKSKGRFKRNKSEKDKKRKKTSNYEVFKQDGISIISKGNNLIIKNTKTPEEQEAQLESMRKNRHLLPAVYGANIEEVIKIFEEYNNLMLLGGLAYNNIALQNNPDDDGLSEVILEYGLSFSTALSGNPTTVPSLDVINSLIKLLASIRHQYRDYIMSEAATGENSLLESEIRFETIVGSLHMRGDGYTKHLYELYNELFSGHDDLFIKKYGFTSNDILKTLIQLENSYCTRIIFPNGIPHPANHNRFIEWSDNINDENALASGTHFIDLFGQYNPDIIVEDSKIVVYPLNQINTYPELYKIRFRDDIHRLVVEAISQKFGDNSAFLHPDYKGLPLNDSTITTNPIIKLGDDYYLFSFSLPTRYLFDIAEALIKKADSHYYSNNFLGNTYPQSRDNFLEKKTSELFKKIMPKSESYLNLKYKPLNESGKSFKTELDLLIKTDYANYLVEMKAGGLSALSKRGVLKSLSSQLEKSVGYGAFQSFRALNFINDNQSPKFHDGKGNEVTIDKSKKFFRITITMAHLANSIANMYALKQLGLIKNEVDFAWTCSILDLMIFSEIIESEEDFIDYLEKRLPLYQMPESNFNDEINILGYYLDKDLKFDKALTKGKTRIGLSKFSSKIDNFFDKGGNKPKKIR